MKLTFSSEVAVLVGWVRVCYGCYSPATLRFLLFTFCIYMHAQSLSFLFHIRIGLAANKSKHTHTHGVNLCYMLRCEIERKRRQDSKERYALQSVRATSHSALKTNMVDFHQKIRLPAFSSAATKKETTSGMAPRIRGFWPVT